MTRFFLNETGIPLYITREYNRKACCQLHKSDTDSRFNIPASIFRSFIFK